MAARAIWQGTLAFKTHSIPVKLYSAVEDQQIHFHLLHKRDKTRVEQRMVDAETHEPVPPDQTRKAYEYEPGAFVIVTEEEVERSVPEASRDVRIRQFVPTHAIDARMFDRPYYLGPGSESATDYFALAEALARKQRVGIASWVMRKHSYVGALLVQDGYLMLISLRHTEEVIPTTDLEPPQGNALDPREKDLAGKLIEALSGEFEPSSYRDGYQERVRELIDAKRKGKTIKPKRIARKPSAGSLADSLRASLEGLQKQRPTGRK